MTKTFTAIDANGNTLYRGRGKSGAAQKAINALYGYRDAVRAASGYLYGNPASMGHIEVDGVRADECFGIAQSLAAA